MSAYPPGVTGNEYAISGPEWEGEAPPPRDAVCDGCGCEVDHGLVTFQAHRDLGEWWVCPVCGGANECSGDEWEVMNAWRSREHRRRGARAARARQESTADLMRRTSPVDYDACRDAGRL